MCRSTVDRPPTGRRCPGCFDPRVRRLANIRQRIGRHARGAEGTTDAARQKHLALLEHAIEDYDRYHDADGDDHAPAADAHHTQSPPAAPHTRAAEFTWASTVDWSDDDLAAAFGELQHDPAAQDAVLNLLDRRDELARQRDSEIRAHQAEQEQARHAAAAAALDEDRESNNRNALTTPAIRPHRRLTAEQQLREDYHAHTYESYLAAEDECRGVMLNKRGRAKGIDPLALFSGPAHVANAYASEELKAWWNAHGRLTFAAFRYQVFGRRADRHAAQNAAITRFAVGG